MKLLILTASLLIIIALLYAAYRIGIKLEQRRNDENDEMDAWR
jgi:hypothetical protein